MLLEFRLESLVRIGIYSLSVIKGLGASDLQARVTALVNRFGGR